MSVDSEKFNYSNTQIHQHGGNKTVRKVLIKKGKGHKSVKHYKNGRMISNGKRNLLPDEISLIQLGKFIPGLFKDCPCNKTKTKTRKHRR